MTPGAWEPNRDRWTRPLIVPPGGGEAVPYTRISTMAKALDKGEALTKWKMRMTAQGLATRRDLLALAASANGDSKTLDQIANDAMEAAAASQGANLGTALHSFTEQIDAGAEVIPPPELQGDLDAYRSVIGQIKVLASEQFVVVDELQVAGSFDRIVEIEGKRMVADIKTGQHEPRFPHGTVVQTAMYAHGVSYGPKGRGVSLAEIGVSQEHAVMIWLPSQQSRCELFRLDIETGWKMARVAAGVRKWFKSTPAARFQ